MAQVSVAIFSAINSGGMLSSGKVSRYKDSVLMAPYFQLEYFGPSHQVLT